MRIRILKNGRFKKGSEVDMVNGIAQKLIKEGKAEEIILVDPSEVMEMLNKNEKKDGKGQWNKRTDIL